MKIAVLGTGMVGEAIASALVRLGHEVRVGARSATNEKAAAWAASAGARASHGTFADAASFGELAFLCVSGAAALDALAAAGEDHLAGKVLVDVTNPLDFGKGMPPSLFVSGDDSLGERIQRAYPRAKVVKTLNTINADVMVDASRVPGEHHVFLSGDDAAAKAQVVEILRAFGWGASSVLDLGDITTARGTEAYVLFWVRVWGALGTPHFNVRVAR